MRNAAGVFRRGTAGEPGYSQVETSPEKMDRAAFAAELGSELFEDAIALQEDAPKAIRVFGIVRRIGLVLLEGDRGIDLVWCRVDLYRNFEDFQRLHDFPIEGGDGKRS